MLSTGEYLLAGSRLEVERLRVQALAWEPETEIIDRLASLARDGGFLALQEPDAATWSCAPACSSWDLLKRLVMHAFDIAGGEFSVGARLGRLLRKCGLQPVAVREAAMTLPGRHPYSKLLLDLARSLEPAILARGWVAAPDFRNALTA